MKRMEFLGSLSLIAASVPMSARAAIPISPTVAGIAIPDTAMAREAEQIARAAEPAPIFNHSLRTYLFAELFARARRIDHDAELVYVASILHDTGLALQYMSKNLPFEVDGANLSRQILERHGITGARADLVWDAIALHDDGGIARWKQPEVRLVNAGVNTDFGAYLSEMQRSDIAAVLAAAPRDGFIDAFLGSVATVAAQKPQATGGSFVVDVGYRRVPGFHLTNFCDAVKDDPFVAFEKI